MILVCIIVVHLSGQDYIKEKGNMQSGLYAKANNLIDPLYMV